MGQQAMSKVTPFDKTDDDAEDSHCCDIYVNKGTASEWKWILKGYCFYMLFSFIECMICAFAMQLVAPFVCHGFWSLMFWTASPCLCDCAKREKDWQGDKGRGCLKCIIKNCMILNIVSAVLYICGSIFMVAVAASTPSKYASPANWKFGDARRLQTLRPILIGATNLAVQTECDDCMATPECCHIWDVCEHKPEDDAATSLTAADAWEVQQGSSGTYKGECSGNPHYCWAPPTIAPPKGKKGTGSEEYWPLVKLGFVLGGGPCWKASRGPRHTGGKDLTFGRGEWMAIMNKKNAEKGGATPAGALATTVVTPAVVGKDADPEELEEVRQSIEEIQGFLERELSGKFEHRIYTNNR